MLALEVQLYGCSHRNIFRHNLMKNYLPLLLFAFVSISCNAKDHTASETASHATETPTDSIYFSIISICNFKVQLVGANNANDGWRSVEAINNKTFYLADQKYYDASVFILRHILEKDPNYAVALLNFADAL